MKKQIKFYGDRGEIFFIEEVYGRRHKVVHLPFSDKEQIIILEYVKKRLQDHMSGYGICEYIVQYIMNKYGVLRMPHFRAKYFVDVLNLEDAKQFGATTRSSGLWWHIMNKENRIAYTDYMISKLKERKKKSKLCLIWEKIKNYIHE
jgi:hypothetical protein